MVTPEGINDKPESVSPNTFQFKKVDFCMNNFLIPPIFKLNRSVDMKNKVLL